jgi:hypothetical protein
MPFWKKTNLKKSIFIYIHDSNVLISNTNPKTQKEVLARLNADKWIKVIKAEFDTQYCQVTFKLDILPPGRKSVMCK